jgi:hypothetical protein
MHGDNDPATEDYFEFLFRTCATPLTRDINTGTDKDIHMKAQPTEPFYCYMNYMD